MKAKLSRTSALGALNPMQKKAVEVYVEQLWQRKQNVVVNRYNLATCLVLSDLHDMSNDELVTCSRV